MKKLLLLGGAQYLLPVIEEAHKLGLYVITCDYLPDNIAHKHSDEYRNVSIIDKDAVLSTARELGIDGIMSFACDPGVVTAAYVAEKLGLPFAGSYEAVSILQNKGRFRRFLTENGFNVPWAKSYTEPADALSDSAGFNWPMIVKPVDSAGSKGVTRVDGPGEIAAAIAHAKAFSICGDFIIEEFITQQGFSSDTDCFSVDGVLRYCSFDEQHFDAHADNPYTPAAYAWPSTMPAWAQAELRGELQRLITLLGLGTGLYNIETRLGTNGKTYIMEVSPRGGGNRLSEVLSMAAETDLIANALNGHEVGFSIFASQIISNVPSALLLSCFTDNARALLIGTNLGGLGTLIASMASLISFKQIARNYHDRRGKYFVLFTAMNLLFLAVLFGIHLLLA